MRIAVLQFDPVVGDFQKNYSLIESAYLSACEQGADILVSSELSLTGYPIYDLVESLDFTSSCEEYFNKLRTLTEGKSCLLSVGHVVPSQKSYGKPFSNAVTILGKGKSVFQQLKTLLPAYDVFDETRIFEPAQDIRAFEFLGKRIVIGICEDVWAGKRYDRNPLEHYEKLKPDLVISFSASPFDVSKFNQRLEVHKSASKRLKCAVMYVNQVGATDEIIFDGGSFILDEASQEAWLLPFFRSEFSVFEWRDGGWDLKSGGAVKGRFNLPAKPTLWEEALCQGIRSYFSRAGFSKAILGVSGGIDSAVVAALAVKSLGNENVIGLAMPSEFSSKSSLEDAEALSKNLEFTLVVDPIKFLHQSAMREMRSILPKNTPLNDLTMQNIQSRLRGFKLMSMSNQLGGLVLATGNKSELAVGYCTMYGDMVGAMAPIGDLWKTQVYDLARHLNRNEFVIPINTLDKLPSAELKHNQTDQDSLPPYEILDELLEASLVRQIPEAKLVEKFENGRDQPGWVKEVLRRVKVNEFKRKQAPFVLRVSSKAFGVGRRLPVIF